MPDWRKIAASRMITFRLRAFLAEQVILDLRRLEDPGFATQTLIAELTDAVVDDATADLDA